MKIIKISKITLIMLIKKINFALVVTGIFFSLILVSENCLAQVQEQDRGFSMSPFFKEIYLEKDQSQENFALEISNDTSYAAIFKLSVLDFGALDESGGVAFLGSSEDLKNKYALASWLSLEKDEISLNSGEKQLLKVMIQNKESLSPGGHYGAVMAKMEIDDSGTGSESSIVAINQSFASLIFVRKIGGEIYNLNLKEQEIEKNLLSLPINVRLRFQNTGNVHATPRGIVKISDPIGREISTGIINGESAIILPETFRKFPTELKNVAVAFIPGKYKVSVSFRFDGKDDFMTQENYFYFFPFKISIVVLVLVVILVFFWRKFSKKNNTKINKNENRK